MLQSIYMVMYAAKFRVLGQVNTDSGLKLSTAMLATAPSL